MREMMTKPNVVYRKFISDSNNAFVGVIEDGNDLTVTISDGVDTVDFDFWVSSHCDKAEAQEWLLRFLGQMEALKFAANAAMDLAQERYDAKVTEDGNDASDAEREEL